MNRSLLSRLVGPLLLVFGVQLFRAAAICPAASYPPAPGKVHSQVVLRTLEGDRAIALSSLRGKKVLLIHFASWSEECRKQMPVWHKKTKKLIADGKLVVLGIAHEQHAERCRLFAQWKGIDWPILYDPLNLVRAESLPLIVAVDEYGVVREFEADPDKLEEAFLSKTFSPPKKTVNVGRAELPDPKVTRRKANDGRTAHVWREHGDALVLAGLPVQLNEAIDSYRTAISMNKSDANSIFRLGVAYRIRYDRAERQPDDFQSAVNAWRQAVEMASGNEVFLERLQQYGPTLGRSQGFYDWIETARKAISEQGDTPVPLPIEPSHMEEAPPAKKFAVESDADAPAEPADKGEQDGSDLVRFDQTVVRGAGKHKNIAAVHLAFWPDRGREVRWDDSAAPLRVWLKQTDKAGVNRQFLTCAKQPQSTADGLRTLCCEVRLPDSADEPIVIDAVAVYAVREGKEGQLRLLHRDLHVRIDSK